MGGLDGASQNGEELSTVCTTQSQATWMCESYYVPPGGLVTSVNQDVADTKATEERNGSVQLSALNLVAGQGLHGVISASALHLLIGKDGDSVGYDSQPSAGGIQLTASEARQQSVSTLSTVAALLPASQRAALAASGLVPGTSARPSAPTQTQASPGTSAPTPTPTPPSTSTEPSSSATSSTMTSSPGLGPSCGTVTGGENDYQGQTLTVHSAPEVSCSTAMRVITDLSTGKAANHQGADQASSYLTVDGWTCPYGNMGFQDCIHGRLRIEATAPGAQP